MTIPTTESSVVMGKTRGSTTALDLRVWEPTPTTPTRPSQLQAPEGSLRPQDRPLQPRDTGPMQQNSRTTITTRWINQVWPTTSLLLNDFFTADSALEQGEAQGVFVFWAALRCSFLNTSETFISIENVGFLPGAALQCIFLNTSETSHFQLKI